MIHIKQNNALGHNQLINNQNHRTWVTITNVNWEKKEGFVSIKVSGDSSTNLALTASLSSCRKAHTHLAFDWPTLCRSTEKIGMDVSSLSKEHAERAIKIDGWIRENLTHKVVPKITNLNFGTINDCDAPNSTKDQILQSFRPCGTTT